MNVAVLVPRRVDNGRRDHVWGWLQQRWASEHPDWTVHEGHHDDGPFNRSAAVNRAASNAGDWDVAVVADCDSFVSKQQADLAVARAVDTGQITFAYNRFAYLSRRMSDRVMAGYSGAWWPGVEWSLTGTCSSQVIVTRELWDTVGGFDEGFVGWGFEDIGFSLSCQTFGGGCQRIAGEVWHLWHPPSVENNAKSVHWQNGLARMKRYETAAYKPDAMRALLDELRTPV